MKAFEGAAREQAAHKSQADVYLGSCLFVLCMLPQHYIMHLNYSCLQFTPASCLGSVPDLHGFCMCVQRLYHLLRENLNEGNAFDW